MNKTIQESEDFVKTFVSLVSGIDDVDILIAPTFVSLDRVSSIIKGTNVILGAQNVYLEPNGAFTGEISPDMLVSAGCSTVIIGHSERREYFSESDEIVNRKIKLARSSGMDVILCIGESLAQREEGRTFDVLGGQLTGSLADINLEGITMAYEPIWAIGTGRTATKEQANEAHTFIRKWLSENKDGADQVRIQYGGSVKPENVVELMSQPEVDGALVGGASLKPDSFAAIVRGASKQ